jgi:hypothetical protein
LKKFRLRRQKDDRATIIEQWAAPFGLPPASENIDEHEQKMQVGAAMRAITNNTPRGIYR